MRSSRTVRFKKNHRKKIPHIQLVIILYAVILSLSQLTSPTSSMFSNTKAVSFSMPSGSWWDRSELLFTASDNQNVTDSCLPAAFSVDVQNNGYSMTSATHYEIFYIENGNPKDGDKIAEDTLDPLEAEEVTTITHEATSTGFYIVKVLQHPDYAGEAENVIWSETIEVSCPAEPTEKEQEEEAKPDTEDTVQEPEKEAPIKTAPPETTDEPVEQPAQEEEKETTTEDTDKDATSDTEETPPAADDNQEQPKDEEVIKEQPSTEQTMKGSETSTDKEKEQSQPEEDAEQSQTESQEGEKK
ncbi:amyloid fiber anchoring/assembly protein TapA [Gracilibacillus caseinilyticus]|uniref:Amyloid fiber anchoring/assembly protein TapA n=1 Tax=Gracilibacillus caseinilyticus TaxID=2932256 RepID=A0ABY4F114_9BACI|nr:amyloid fiber anchoring/assembly protein TapA [Gracilibacillus caseinilyticus]UOQ50364.1 amyloid fiber anchoring/assembly protein TapA [Gracilibacillus caseinilyticus]